MAELTLQPMPIRTGTQDEAGCLVLVDGKLLCVLVRLDDPMHGEDQGKWYLEAVFDARRGTTMTFLTLGEAEWWICRELRKQDANAAECRQVAEAAVPKASEKNLH